MDFYTNDIESDFEPLTRTRSNTWPMPRPEGYVDRPLADDIATPSTSGFRRTDSPSQPTTPEKRGLSRTMKKSNRKNAWGKISYAELISQAISSVADQRLTLSQIYTWIMENVPFFKDKGDRKSSAGWKNSVRHNLSLHDRFVRVPNEGPGKSSWWVINPDVGLGQTTRQRTASMEADKFEKKRVRAKKRVDTSRKEQPQSDAIPSTSSGIKQEIDFFPGESVNMASNVQTLPFRSRASSCASAFGRLSPIPAVPYETEWTAEYVSQASGVDGKVQVHANPITFEECLEPVEESTSVDVGPIVSYASDVVNQPLIYGYTNQFNYTLQSDVQYSVQDGSFIPADICSMGPTSADELVSQTRAAPVLVRNNSLLQDIDDIITQEQCSTSVDVADINDAIGQRMNAAPMVHNNLTLQNVDEVMINEDLASMALSAALGAMNNYPETSATRQHSRMN